MRNTHGVRIATLPGKLLPGMHLFPPLMANRLGRAPGGSAPGGRAPGGRAPGGRAPGGSAPGGLDLGLPRVGEVAFGSLTALAVRSTHMEGAEIPILLLFVGGQRRPFAVYATKVQAADFGIEGSAHRPAELRALVLRLAEQAPHLVIDEVTWDFLQGRMLTSIGAKLGDLADAIGLILVNKEPLKEVDLPGAKVPAPSPAEAPGIWVSPAGNVLVAFARRSVFLAGMKADEITPAAERLRAGADPREVLGSRVGEIPNTAFARIRRDRGSKAVELELRTKDGTRKTLIPYAEDAAGDELFEAFKNHLGSGRRSK